MLSRSVVLLLFPFHYWSHWSLIPSLPPIWNWFWGEYSIYWWRKKLKDLSSHRKEALHFLSAQNSWKCSYSQNGIEWNQDLQTYCDWTSRVFTLGTMLETFLENIIFQEESNNSFPCIAGSIHYLWISIQIIYEEISQ